MPGPYPGRVVEVHHPGSLTDVQEVLFTDVSGDHYYTKRDRDAVRTMLDRGMKELVGSDDPMDGWKQFFQKGDRVGIKIVPVGKPDSISSHELVLEIIDALEKVGIAKKNVLVFDRYKSSFTQCRYHEILPDGVKWECSSAGFDAAQLEIDGQLPDEPRESHVAGYDPDVYREFAFCQPASIHDPKDDRRFRSHLSNIITKKVDKFINIPVLKDHRSAGVTLALKNMSHGCSNNVARSHVWYHWLDEQNQAHYQGDSLNQCNTFIPAIVSLPPIREKAVLHIMDGLVGTYEGGPGGYSSFATWQYKSLFFSTDPVAIDRVGWELVDAERIRRGLPTVAQAGADGKNNFVKVPYEDSEVVYPEQFHIRQPQHIPLAALLGLGVFAKEGERRDGAYDGPATVEHRRIDLV